VTSEVRHVLTYLGPNQVAEGFYTFDDETLRMVFADGKPVELDDQPVIETVISEHVEAVAKKLTRRIRKAFRGETVEGFGRSLTYEREAFA
jgi:hypothetical protein